MSLGIRFSRASIPDLQLPLPAPGTPLPVFSVKHQIRKDRAQDTARRRLRLIYGGRALPDADDLVKTIKPITEHYNSDNSSSASLAVKTGDNEQPLTIWLLCSVGDVLTDEELAQESDSGVCSLFAIPISWIFTNKQ